MIRDRVNVLAESLRTRLREVPGARGINVRLMPMTVLGRYDHDARGLDTLIRASVHYFNDEDEIDRLVAAVRDVVKPT